MDEQGIRKTYKYKLKPTREQEQAMAFVLRRCRELYNAALQERCDAWQKCGVNITAVGRSSTDLLAPSRRRFHYAEPDALAM